MSNLNGSPTPDLTICDLSPRTWQANGLHMALLGTDEPLHFNVKVTQQMMNQFFSRTENERLHREAAAVHDKREQQWKSQRLFPTPPTAGQEPMFAVQPSKEAIQSFFSSAVNAQLNREGVVKLAQQEEQRQAALLAMPSVVGPSREQLRKFFGVPHLTPTPSEASACTVPDSSTVQFLQGEGGGIQEKVKFMLQHPKFAAFMNDCEFWDIGKNPDPSVDSVMAGEPQLVIEDFVKFIRGAAAGKTSSASPAAEAADQTTLPATLPMPPVPSLASMSACPLSATGLLAEALAAGEQLPTPVPTPAPSALSSPNQVQERPPDDLELALEQIMNEAETEAATGCDGNAAKAAPKPKQGMAAGAVQKKAFDALFNLPTPSPVPDAAAPKKATAAPAAKTTAEAGTRREREREGEEERVREREGASERKREPHMQYMNT